MTKYSIGLRETEKSSPLGCQHLKSGMFIDPLIKYNGSTGIHRQSPSSLQHNILRSFCCVLVLWRESVSQLSNCDVIVIITKKSSTGDKLFPLCGWD